MTGISFVTTVLDRADTVAEALASVAAQMGPEDEHVVVDGGSVDGTREVVARFPGIKFVPADGTGIYEALDIGIAAASRRFVMVINSDDWLADGAVLRMRQAGEARGQTTLIRGRAAFVSANGERRDVTPAAISTAQFNPRTILCGPLCINAFLIARTLFEELGGFDRGLSIAADREWMLRAWLAGCRPMEIDTVVYKYRVHSASLTIRPDRRPNPQVLSEHFSIMDKYLARNVASLKKDLRFWEAREIGRLVSVRLSGTKTPELFPRMAIASRRNPLWPLSLAKQALRRLR
jgi:glycosyltransferase involved in cell wall biosynthesis